MPKCPKCTVCFLRGYKSHSHLAVVLCVHADDYVQISSCHYYKHGHYLEEGKRFHFLDTSALHVQTCKPRRVNMHRPVRMLKWSQRLSKQTKNKYSATICFRCNPFTNHLFNQFLIRFTGNICSFQSETLL